MSNDNTYTGQPTDCSVTMYAGPDTAPWKSPRPGPIPSPEEMKRIALGDASVADLIDLMDRIAALEEKVAEQTPLAMLVTALQRRCSTCGELPMLTIVEGDRGAELWLQCIHGHQLANGGTDIEAAFKHVGRMWLAMS